MEKAIPLQNANEFDSFFKTALTIKGSITPKVLPRVLLFLLYSTLVSLLYQAVPQIALPVGPFEYAGLAMGLILVFRVNAGYERWSEARKLWGSIVNSCRNYAITLTANCKNPNDPTVIALFAALSSLANSMRERLSVDAEAKTPALITDAPLVDSLNLSKLLNELKKNKQVSGYMQLLLEQKRSELMDSLGGCERILKTPMPFMMAVKSRRFILFFLLMLPFALVNTTNTFTPFIDCLVSYTLLSLDQIGLEMQKPFSMDSISHLPLNDITKTIDNNLETILSQAENAPPA